LFRVGKKYEGKDIPYDYKHVLTFTENAQEFKVNEEMFLRIWLLCTSVPVQFHVKVLAAKNSTTPW
jgi:hypothetical protein